MKYSVWLASMCSLFITSPAVAQRILDRVTPHENLPEAPRPVDRAAQPQIEFNSAPPPSLNASGHLLIGAVSIAGLKVLGPDDFSDIIADYLGQTADADDLAALAERLALRARERGFIFATAHIAPQRLAMGVLNVIVDEGHVDDVRLNGSDNAAVSKALASITRGPVTLAQLERALMIAGDIDGIQIRRSRLVTEGNRRVLVVEVHEDRVTADVSLRNDGTRPIGREKVYITAVLSQLLDADDSVTLGYAATPFEPSEMQYGRVRYEKRLNASGTEATAAFSYSLVQPGDYLSRFDIEGRAWSANIGLLQPLQRSRDASLWLTANLELNRLNQRRVGNLVRRDRTTVLRVGFYGYRDALGGRIRGGAVISQGLDLFDATQPRDPLASRFDSDATFTSFSAWGQWTGSLAPRVSLQVAATAQLATQALLVGEELSLGGGTYLRGYDWSERSGDEGVMGYAELRYEVVKPFGLRYAQVYGFADAGEVSNLSDGFGGGSLASAGGGLRLGLDRSLDASMEVAQPLSGPRYDTGDRQPRINLSISKRL